jgi:hypothetical protein
MMAPPSQPPGPPTGLPSPLPPVTAPLLRTYASALLASSALGALLTGGLSFLSSLLMASIALVLLCARGPQMESEVQCLAAAPAAAWCPPRSSGAQRLGHIQALAIAATVLGCLEVAGSASLFAVVGIPFTARFSANSLSPGQPFFSRALPRVFVPGFGLRTPQQLPLPTFLDWSSYTTAPPPLPPMTSFQQNYTNMDGGGAFSPATTGCMAIDEGTSTAPGGRFRANYIPECTMVSPLDWTTYWNNGINPFTASYRGQLLAVNLGLGSLGQRMFSAYNNAYTATALGTFQSTWDTVTEIYFSSATAAAGVVSAVNMAWGGTTLALLSALHPGGLQSTTGSLFSFFHYPRTLPAVLAFSLALTMLAAGCVLLPGPTCLAGLCCLLLAQCWLHLLRAPWALQEASNEVGWNATKRLRFAALGAGALAVLQLGLSSLVLLRAFNVGAAIPPPSPASLAGLVMPAVPNIAGVLAGTRFFGGGFGDLSDLNIAVSNTLIQTRVGRQTNAGSSDTFSAVFLPIALPSGTTIFSQVNCIAASSQLPNNRVRAPQLSMTLYSSRKFSSL